MNSKTFTASIIGLLMQVQAAIVQPEMKYAFGNECTNPDDPEISLCGPDCTTGCSWSWPTTDEAGCDS